MPALEARHIVQAVEDASTESVASVVWKSSQLKKSMPYRLSADEL